MDAKDELYYRRLYKDMYKQMWRHSWHPAGPHMMNRSWCRNKGMFFWPFVGAFLGTYAYNAFSEHNQERRERRKKYKVLEEKFFDKIK